MSFGAEESPDSLHAKVLEAMGRLGDEVVVLVDLPGGTPAMGDPHGWVVERIAASIEKYVRAFNLFGSAELLGLSRVHVGRKQST